MKVIHIKDFGEPTEEVLCSKEFPNAFDMWDKEISDYSYKN